MPPVRLTRTLIRVAGPDAITFLDNLLTQNVKLLDTQPVIYAGLLSPQGKVVADMHLWSDSDEDENAIIIEADPVRGADLLKRLSLYKLRAQVEIYDASEEYTPLFSTQEFPGAVADPRMPNGALGWRDLSPLPPQLSNVSEDAGEYANLHLAVGAPILASDAAPEEVFALEALFEELHGVDFQKGCFVGQENVSRMKRRATTRKKFCPVTFDGPPPASGGVIRAGEAELGSLRHVGADRALALLRLDRALEAQRQGKPLVTGETVLHLAPPDWLLLPTED